MEQAHDAYKKVATDHMTWSKKSAEERLKETKFMVEATGFERMMLWSRHAVDGDSIKEKTPQTWKQCNPGWSVCVGMLGTMPCNFQLDWVEIDGFLVCFYDDCSQVVDHRMIEDWIEKNFKATWGGGRPATTNAMNFHHCLNALDEWKKSKGKSIDVDELVESILQSIQDSETDEMDWTESIPRASLRTPNTWSAGEWIGAIVGWSIVTSVVKIGLESVIALWK